MLDIKSLLGLDLNTAPDRQYPLGVQLNQVLLWLMALFISLLGVTYLLGLVEIPDPRAFIVLPAVIVVAWWHNKLAQGGHYKIISVAMISLLLLAMVTAFINGYPSAALAPIYMLALMANYRGRYRLLAPYILLGVHATLINIGPVPGAYEYQLRIFLMSLVMVYPLHLLFEAQNFDEALKRNAFRGVCFGVAGALFALVCSDLLTLGSLRTAPQIIPGALFFVAMGHYYGHLLVRVKNAKVLIVVAIVLLFANAVTANGILPATLIPMGALVFCLLLSSFNALMLSLALTLVVSLGIYTTTPTDFELTSLAFRLFGAAAIYSLLLKVLFKQLETEAGLPTVPLIALLKVLPLSLAATAGVAVLMFDGFHVEQMQEFLTDQINLHTAKEVIGLILTALLFTWGFGSFWIRSYQLDKSNQQSKKLLVELELALRAGEISVYELDVESGDALFLAGYHPILQVGDHINVKEYAYRVASPTDAQMILRTFSGEKSECLFAARYTPNEKPRWSRIVTGSFYEVDGRRKNLYIRSDVTELQESISSMRRSNERQRDLFAVIGHELRTPVASVDMLINDNEMSDTDKLSNIREINQGLLNILDDMRTVVTPERAQSAEFVVGNPGKVVTRALTPLTPLLTERGITAEVSVSAALEHSFRYREQALRQLVTNLVKNAALHSGGTTLWVGLSEAQNETGLVTATLRVADNGKGIPGADLDLVFAAFGRGDTQSEGSGLGLYISRELARRLGGELSYQPSPHGGAKFSVTFPLEPVEPDQNAQEPAAEAIPSNLDGLRILVAEDDGMLRMLTEKALSKHGAMVTLAEDGAKAFEAYHRSQFDLVLTDLMMPNMSGEALTRALRERGETLPIIAVTAAVIGEETDRLQAAGVDRVISKPISVEKLAMALSDIALGKDKTA